MEYLTAKQFASIWRISERRIIKLCNENRISGAVKNGMIWELPKDTIKPSDKRSNIYKYINVEQRILIAGSPKQIKDDLQELLMRQGYVTEFINDLVADKAIDRYYEGLIVFPNNDDSKKLEKFINSFSFKLNYESSIVVASRKNMIKPDLAETLNKEIGVRINTLLLDYSEEDDDINYSEIAQDIINLLISFKNTNGAVIPTNAGKLRFDNNKKTRALMTGEHYSAINKYFKSLDTNSYIWCASTMLEDEWTEEPQEMKFRVLNLDVANRGVKMERIFIFSKKRIKEFKNNKTLRIYMQSNINTMFVDYDEILEKKPELLKIVGAGWDGIDKSILIADVSDSNEGRGYISKNKKEVERAYNCFQELKKYAKSLKEVLK